MLRKAAIGKIISRLFTVGGDFIKSATLRRDTGAYDPATGAVGAGSTSSTCRLIPETDPTTLRDYMETGLIRSGQSVLYVEGATFRPRGGDQIEVAGEPTRRVTSVEDLVGASLLYVVGVE